MSSEPYFKIITSESAFNARCVAEKAQPFTKLSDAAASRWGRKDLFACRVIIRRQRDRLPLLEGFDTALVSLCPEIVHFIQGPEQEHMNWCELGLVRHYGPTLGLVWAGLAMFKGPQDRRQPAIVKSEDSDGESDSECSFEVVERRKRIRRNTAQYQFTDSGNMQVGSSSPLAEGSQGASSIDYIDPESHMLASQPEDETLHFIRCATRYILYFAPAQAGSNVETVVEVRDAKVRLAIATPVFGRSLVYVDDGGLCLRQKNERVFKTLKNRVVMFETKGKLNYLEDGRPILSDACMAQMTCQALTARLADPQKELADGRYVDCKTCPGYSNCT